jgi:hypothetical protein
MLSSPLRQSPSLASATVIVEFMIDVAHSWRSGSMVFASVTRGLLACPRPCELYTSLAYNAGCTSHATSVNRRACCQQLVWASLHARGPRWAMPNNFHDTVRATWQHCTSA